MKSKLFELTLYRGIMGEYDPNYDEFTYEWGQPSDKKVQHLTDDPESAKWYGSEENIANIKILNNKNKKKIPRYLLTFEDVPEDFFEEVYYAPEGNELLPENGYVIRNEDNEENGEYVDVHRKLKPTKIEKIS
jgi:hypothetical protein